MWDLGGLGVGFRVEGSEGRAHLGTNGVVCPRNWGWPANALAYKQFIKLSL